MLGLLSHALVTSRFRARGSETRAQPLIRHSRCQRRRSTAGFASERVVTSSGGDQGADNTGERGGTGGRRDPVPSRRREAARRSPRRRCGQPGIVTNTRGINRIDSASRGIVHHRGAEDHDGRSPPRHPQPVASASATTRTLPIGRSVRVAAGGRPAWTRRSARSPTRSLMLIMGARSGTLRSFAAFAQP
jgi:hypothetical protein